MSTLDINTNECTKDVIVVAASKAGRVVQRVLYNFCPANQDSCYLGKYRLKKHTCSLGGSNNN